MRNISQFGHVSLAVLLMGTVSAPALLAAEIDLDTKIDTVKLYRDHGAVLQRSGVITLPQGSHIITIRGLPADIDQSYGIRAALPAGAGQITGVTLDKVFAASTTSSEQQAIENQIEALRIQMGKDRGKLEAIDIEIGFLSKITSNSAASSADTLTLIRDNAQRLTEEKRRLNEALSVNSLEVLALDKQLKQTGTVRKATTTATISLSKFSSTEMPFGFSYLSPAASWSVKAHADVNTSADTLDLKLTAQIRQQTGENWSNVPVSLSTSRLNYGLGVSLPSPVYNNIAEKPRTRRSEERLQQASAPRVLADAADETMKMEISVGNFEAEFKPLQPLSLNSNGSPQNILVLSESVPIELKVRVSPKIDSGAYLFGAAKFESMPDISAPQITITRDGQYLGRGQWPDLKSDEVLDLPLGYIEQITTEVIKLPSEDGESGIFGRSIIDETKNRFTVSNNLSSEYTIEVYDVLPQSMNEDLEIEPLSGNTRYSATDVDGKPGVMMWRKTMKAGETWSINHWYRTKYPQGQVLTREWR